MEYLDEEAKPRFLFQSRAFAPSSSSSAQNPSETLIKVGKLHAAACFSAAVALLLPLLPALSLSQNETLTFLLIWISLSLLAGPFAPPSLTGGDVRVGRGELLPPPPDPVPPEIEEPTKRNPGRRGRSRPSDPPLIPDAARSTFSGTPEMVNGDHPICNDSGGSGKEDKEEEESEKEWNDEDFEILKKQILKHPVGEPRRWERITEAFRGRHGLESVIKTAKSLSEKRPGSGDSFVQFLKQRKPLDKRAEAVNAESNDCILLEDCDSKRENGVEDGSWSAGEDIALLNALKAFPKDVPMRWEKITAAVPGKSKARCMKRVTELKKDFRSSKASAN